METVSRRKGIFMKGQLKVSVYMNYGHLTVHVVQGRHLSTAQKPQPNTFVMISLIPEELGVTPTRCRTAVVANTSCPSYNEKFSFEVGEEDAHKRLLLTVYLRDHSGHHKSLGCTSFGVRRLRQEELEVNGWYHLLTDDIGRKKHHRVATRVRPSVPVMQSREPRQIPSVNNDVPAFDRLIVHVQRSAFGGFGFTVMDSCPVKIGRVDGSSFAERAGLQKGDCIIRVNGQNVSRSTSVSVAKLIKKSDGMVRLEVQRPGNYATPTAHQDPASFSEKTSKCDSDDPSFQEFTICDDQTALLSPAISVDTRRQAALHRLLCLEENFVDLMNDGIDMFSRPLRHCVITSSQHAVLFQNIEKLVCMSQYQVRQILDNLPTHAPSDEDTDASFSGESDLTSAVGMIYSSKLSVLCGAYLMYTGGLTRAATLLTSLEKNDQFCGFLLNVPSQERELSLCDFLNRPLHHLEELFGLLSIISQNTMPHSEERAMFAEVLSGLQPVVSQICVTPKLKSRRPALPKKTAPPTTATQRLVPLMGSLVLKRSSSERSSSSGFCSAGSQQSDSASQTGSESQLSECDHNTVLSTLV